MDYSSVELPAFLPASEGRLRVFCFECTIRCPTETRWVVVQFQAYFHYIEPVVVFSRQASAPIMVTEGSKEACMALEPKSAIAQRKLRRCESTVRQSGERVASRPGGAHSLERRRKARYPTDDSVDAGIVHSDYQRFPRTVLGVFRSRLPVDLRITIAGGTAIRRAPRAASRHPAVSLQTTSTYGAVK
jgi:hypothetical protein